MTPEERFERIEKTLQQVAEGQKVFQAGMEQLRQRQADSAAGMEQLRERQGDLQSAHIELEAAQLNQVKVHSRLEEVVADMGERIVNLTIAVDRLIARDLES